MEAHRLADIAHDTFVQHLDAAPDPEVRVEPKQAESAVEKGRPAKKDASKPQADTPVSGDLRTKKTIKIRTCTRHKRRVTGGPLHSSWRARCASLCADCQ